jgi:hypothetical protein
MKNLFYTLFIGMFLLSCGTENNPTYTLTTTVSPSEGGTISPSSGEFPEGEVISLTGIPTSSGWRFVRWEGDWSSSQNPTSITMNRDYSVVGVFERKNYPLNITIIGEGTVEERIIQQKSTEYPYETVVELTPVPSNGWKFQSWGGDLSGSEVPIQVTVSSEKNVTVTFTPNIYLSENGVIIMCPNVPIGLVGVVDGVEYEVVDRELLIQRRDEGGDLTKVCVSNVTDMGWVFSGTLHKINTFNQNIQNWDVSSVTDMSRMFSFSEFNQSIENWDVSSVTDMSGMFSFSEFNQSIENWDVSSVTDMSGMFSFSEFNQSIENWDVSSVTDMSGMFYLSVFNQLIGGWDVSSVTLMENMFTQSTFNQHIGDWDVSNVVNISQMFLGSVFNQPIGDWDVSSVWNMSDMFTRSQFNQPIGNWNVRRVLFLDGMFQNSLFNQPINQWCVRHITSEPPDFSTNSPLTPQNKPVWGTCPTP